MSKTSQHINIKNLKPFIIATVAWFLVVTLLAIGRPSQFYFLSLIIGLLVVLDLFSTARALAPFFDAHTDEENLKKNRISVLFRAFTWGAIKLVSLTILGAMLLKYRDISLAVSLMGLSVYFFIPLVGGGLWFRENRFEFNQGPPPEPSKYDGSKWGTFRADAADDSE